MVGLRRNRFCEAHTTYFVLSAKQTRFLNMKKQIHAYYSGQVQGVGFRFTASNIANELGVTGWVKNLRDGRVEVVAEAEEEVLKDFLDKIRQYFSRYIQDVDVRWQEPRAEFTDFGIEF